MAQQRQMMTLPDGVLTAARVTTAYMTTTDLTSSQNKLDSVYVLHPYLHHLTKTINTFCTKAQYVLIKLDFHNQQ